MVLVMILFSRRILPPRLALYLERFQSWLIANYLLLLVAAAAVYFFTSTLPFVSRLPQLLTDLFQLLNDTVAASDGSLEQKSAIRGIAYAIGTLLAVMALTFAIPFTFIRIWLGERTTQATELGILGDRFQKAVDQLGAVRSSAQNGVQIDIPNVEARVAALLFLEKLARANRAHYLTVIELICAYLRQNAPRRSMMPERTLRPDVAMAIQILGRRSALDLDFERRGAQGAAAFRLDLRRTDFRGADLRDANLGAALLDGADLRGADLTGTNLSGASLLGAVISPPGAPPRQNVAEISQAPS